MIRLDNLKPAPGSRHRKKIIGRGEGSGHGGKGSTRGFKGQTARSGDSSLPPGFEGGQVPLFRRIPKRGFNNTAFRNSFSIVNVGDIEALFDGGAEISAGDLKKAGLIRQNLPVKILGDGDVTKAFQIKADAFSKSALEKIKKAGGTIEKIGEKPKTGKQKAKK
jgi:large subunit ribosomal protein L15